MSRAQPFRGHPSKQDYCVARQRAGLTPQEIADESGLSVHRVYGALNKAAGGVRAKLQAAATRRGVRAIVLKHMIINRVVHDGLIDAVLDDGDGHGGHHTGNQGDQP